MLCSYDDNGKVELVTFIKKETSNFALCIQNGNPRYLEIAKLDPIKDPRKEWIFIHRGDVVIIGNQPE
jgi:hypothetical protein